MQGLIQKKLQLQIMLMQSSRSVVSINVSPKILLLALHLLLIITPNKLEPTLTELIIKFSTNRPHMQTFLIVWFSLTALSVAYVAYDLFTSTPEMKVMKWGWILVTLYTGIFGLIVYILSCREPAPYTHEKFVAPLWKQTVGSTIHCMAGDATGIIIVAFITAQLNLKMGTDAILEYIAGFAFGLFIFQSLFMKKMLGGSYRKAVNKTWYAEWLSMNFVMAGMNP